MNLDANHDRNRKPHLVKCLRLQVLAGRRALQWMIEQ